MNDNKILSCKSNVIHEDKIEIAKTHMPNENEIDGVTELFKTLGDPTRTRILSVLYTGELCVCDICNLLGMTKSAISHQLKVLKMTRLIKARRSGKEVYYSLADDHIFSIYQIAIEHVRERD